jgi:hypothetical protein
MNKNLNITILVKNVYGKDLVYPSCTKSKLFAKLCNSKTLTHPTLNIINCLGYKIKIKNTPEYLFNNDKYWLVDGVYTDKNNLYRDKLGLIINQN